MSEYEAKWIHVYQNNDPHFAGVRFMVSSSQIKDEDVLLREITKKIKPPFGAIRKLYTPVNGTRIRKLGEIKTHRKYVAAGAEKFKQVPGGYMSIGQENRVLNPKLVKTSTTGKEFNITIFRNGKPEEFKTINHTENNKVNQIHSILKYLNGVFPLKKGSYEHLYTVNGKLITNSTELENSSSYVVVTNYEWFKKAPYGQEKPVPVAKKSTLSSKQSPSSVPEEVVIAENQIKFHASSLDLVSSKTEVPEILEERPSRRLSDSALIKTPQNEPRNHSATSVLIVKKDDKTKRTVSLQTERPFRSHSSVSNTLSLMLDLHSAQVKKPSEKWEPAQVNNWLLPPVPDPDLKEKPSLIGLYRAKQLSTSFRRVPNDTHHVTEEISPPMKENSLVKETKSSEQKSEMNAETPIKKDGTETQKFVPDPTQGAEAARLMESFQSFLSSSMATQKKFFKEPISYDNTSAAVPDKRVHFNMDDDPSGIFRAKTKILSGASEVPDSPTVIVDLPIDLKPTETVQVKTDKIYKKHKSLNFGLRRKYIGYSLLRTTTDDNFVKPH